MDVSEPTMEQLRKEVSKELATHLQHLETVIATARAARIVALLDVMNRLEGNEKALDVVNDLLIDAGR